MKRVELDGKFYRKRRGVLVEIPPEWVDQTTHSQTIRKRDSKQIRKQRMREFRPGRHRGHPTTWAPRHTAGARTWPSS